MTGLQVWLHPSSRTVKTVVGSLSLASVFAPANDLRPKTKDAFLNSTAFWRTAAVMRDRRGVFDITHLNASHSGIARHHSGVRSGLPGSEWRALARPAESERTGTLPREHVPSLVG